MKLMKLIARLVGDDLNFKLEDRLFNTITLINGVTNFIGVIGVLQLENYKFLLVVQLGTGFFFLGCYYLSRFKGFGRKLYWPFIMAIAGFLFLSSIYNAGIAGGTHYYVFPALVVAIVLAQSITDILLSVLLFSSMIFGLVLISELAPQWIVQYANKNEQLFDVTANLLFVEIFIGGIVLVLMRNLNVERRKSDRLLVNVLPESIAEELKRFEKVEPKEYEASILFTDFEGFTKVSEQLKPHELLHRLDTCFTAFDKICRDNNLEKIKTVGDSYMAVGGVPLANQNHAEDCVRAGIAMRDFVKAHYEYYHNLNLPAWNVRIGVNTGNLVAGVIGQKKFAYDVWGDSVNTASRIESSGVANEVNISESTYQLVKDKFDCLYRGKISAKNKGEISMYLVQASKVATK